MSDGMRAEVMIWHKQLSEIEDKIDALQEQKKVIYDSIRRDYDRRTAEGMKCAVRYLRMDPTKREEHFMFTDAGRSFMKIIQQGDVPVEPWHLAREQERSQPFPENDNEAEVSSVAQT